MPGFVILVAAGLLPTVLPPTADQPRKVKPVVAWHASVEHKAGLSFSRCDSTAQWVEAWDRYRGRGDGGGESTRPEIDFGAYMVVVIRHGEPAACTHLYDFVEEAGCIRVRYRPGSIQTGVIAGRSESEIEEQSRRLDRAYTFRLTFVVLPASKKALVFEEDVANSLAGPPKWKERARLPSRERKRGVGSVEPGAAPDRGGR